MAVRMTTCYNNDIYTNEKMPFHLFFIFFVNFISHSDVRHENGDKNMAKYSSNIDIVSEDLSVSYFLLLIQVS